MTKFLFTVWPFSGHIHPSLAVAHALRARGHQVAFYTGSKVGELIEGEGFRCFPFQQVDEARVEQLVLSNKGIMAPVRNPLRRAAMWRTWLLGTVPAQLADLEPILIEWQPDVIVCDPSMWAPLLVLHETRRIPIAVLSIVAACLLPGPQGPILGFPMPPPRTRYERGRAQLLRRIVDLLGTGVRRRANRLRRAYGLPALQMSVTAFTGQMPLYLVPSSPEFDYERKDLPASVRYIGPCLWTKPAGETPPPWLRELASDQPMVFVTEGTVNLQPLLLRAAAKGLANLPLQIIMTTGKHREPEALGLAQRSLAANIRVEQWVPLDDLLPRLSAIVTTGGSNTVLAALSNAVPLVLVPSEWDQPETAWRVVEAGAGVRLTPEECTPEGLRQAVERVLREPSFRENAQRLAASFARLGGPARGAVLLEALSCQP